MTDDRDILDRLQPIIDVRSGDEDNRYCHVRLGDIRAAISEITMRRVEIERLRQWIERTS